MAGTVPGVRFVKCPKCLKLLTEFADVPVYKCGGCGTILRAKNRTSTGQNMTAGSVGNTSQNLPDSGSLSHGLSSSGMDMISGSSELGSEREKAVPINIQPSYPTDLSNSHEKGESSEQEKDRIEVRGLGQHDPQLTDHLGPETNGTNIRMENTSKLCQQGHESLKLSDRMEDSTESTDLDTSSEEDTAGGVYDKRHGHISKSASRSSHAYDASASSDDVCNGHDCNNHTVLPESTFTHKKVLDSIDTKGKEADEDDFEESKMATDTGAQFQVQDFPAKPSNEMIDSTVMDRFDSNVDELPSKHKIHERKWETSLDSEDFHSVQNTLEQKNEGSLRISRDTFSHEDSLDHPYGSSSAKLKSFERDGMKILKKVDELRDELSELFDKAAEGKGKPVFRGSRQESITKPVNSNLVLPSRVYQPRTLIPQQNRPSQIPLPEQPPCSCLRCHHEDCKISIQLPAHICCHNGHCRACAYDIPCHSSKAVRPRLHMDSIPPSCSNKAKVPPDVESEKLHCKEKRPLMRQYCRPVFGGAPFVICYSCLSLLKLPVDFSASGKRLHKLQCGACSKVLLFTYRARAYAVPYTPTEVRHPPSEVDNGTETSTVNEIPASHFNDCCPGDPVSFSEEYGLSLGMSYSMEVEPALHALKNSSDMMEERDGKQENGSQLHRLMGYSSATEILRQPLDVDDKFGSRGPTMHRHRRSKEEHARVDHKGKGICIPDDSATRISSNSMEIHEEDELPKKLKTRRIGSPLHRLLKKGIREVSHGLEIMKLRAHSDGSYRFS